MPQGSITVEGLAPLNTFQQKGLDLALKDLGRESFARGFAVSAGWRLLSGAPCLRPRRAVLLCTCLGR